MTAHTLGGNYKLGSTKLSSIVVYTNTPPNGAFELAMAFITPLLWSVILMRFVKL